MGEKARRAVTDGSREVVPVPTADGPVHIGTFAVDRWVGVWFDDLPPTDRGWSSDRRTSGPGGTPASAGRSCSLEP